MKDSLTEMSSLLSSFSSFHLSSTSQPLSQPLSPLPSSANISHSGLLHLYLSDVLWILEVVLISSRGDIDCAHR